MLATYSSVSNDGMVSNQRATTSASEVEFRNTLSGSGSATSPSFMSGLDAALRSEAVPPLVTSLTSSAAALAVGSAPTSIAATAHPAYVSLQVLNHQPASLSLPQASDFATISEPAGRLPAVAAEDTRADENAVRSRIMRPTPSDLPVPDDAGLQDDASASGGRASSSAEASTLRSLSLKHDNTAHHAPAADSTLFAVEANPPSAIAMAAAVPVLPTPYQSTPQDSDISARSANAAAQQDHASERTVPVAPRGSNLPAPPDVSDRASISTVAGLELGGSLQPAPRADTIPKQSASAAGSASASSPSGAIASLASGNESIVLQGAKPVATPIAATADTAALLHTSAADRRADTPSEATGQNGSRATASRPGSKSASSKAARRPATVSSAPLLQDVASDSPVGRPVGQTVTKTSSVNSDAQKDHPHAPNAVAETAVSRSTASTSAVLVGLQATVDAATTQVQEAPSAQSAAPEVVRSDMAAASGDQALAADAETSTSTVASGGDSTARDLTPTETVGGLMAQGSSAASGTKLTVSLHPKELGAVTVELARAVDGTTTVRVSADTPSTLRTLMADRDQLHAALDAASVPVTGRHLTFELSAASASVTMQHTHAAVAEHKSQTVAQDQSDSRLNSDTANARNTGQQGGGTTKDERRRSQPDHHGASDLIDSIVVSSSIGSATSPTRRASMAGINITA